MRECVFCKGGTAALIPSGPAPPSRPSADLLLATLAAVLPLSCCPGRAKTLPPGATAVHHFGGTVIVSSLETLARSAMPRATMFRDDINDHVVPVDDRAGFLVAFTTAPLIEPHP